MPMKNPPHRGDLIKTEVIEALGLNVSKAAYILASSGKSVGGRVSASRPAEESAELVTGGVEGRLLIFAAVIEQRSAVFDHLRKDSVHGFLSQGRIVMEIADELPAQRPHIIDVSLNRFRREFRCGERFKERSEQRQQLFTGRQIFFQPHP